jgi:hypothetical protein
MDCIRALLIYIPVQSTGSESFAPSIFMGGWCVSVIMNAHKRTSHFFHFCKGWSLHFASVKLQSCWKRTEIHLGPNSVPCALR